MHSGVLRLIEHDHRIIESPAPHECQRGYLYHIGLHILLELDRRDHVLKRIIERLEIGVDLVLHVAGQEPELLASLHSGTRQDDLAHLLVLKSLNGKGYRYIGLSCACRTERKRQVVLPERLYQKSLIGIARRYSLAVYAVDDHIVLLRFGRGIALHNIENHLLGKLVESGAILLQLLDLPFELGCLGIVAYHLYHRTASRHAQLREEVAYEMHIAVVDTIETDRVNIIDDYNSLYHKYIW